MALAKMKKATAVTFTADKDALMSILVASGAAEITSTAELDGTGAAVAPEERDGYVSRLARLNFVFGFLKDCRKEATKLNSESYTYKAPKIGFLDYARPSVTLEQLTSAKEKEEELFRQVAELESANNSLLDYKSETARNQNLLEQLSVYSEVDAALDRFCDTRRTAFLLGAVPSEKLALLKSAQELPYSFVETYGLSKMTAVAAVCPLENKDELLTALAEADFVKCSFSFAATAAEKCAEYRDTLADIENSRQELIKTVVGYDAIETDLKLLYDYYELQLKKLSADESCRFTKETFVLTFWLPTEAEAVISKAVEDKGIACDLTFEEPAETEEYPTLAYNNKVIRPYESITNMYSVPNCREKDPNTFMAFFYFLLFGIMLGDAAYGIILSIVGFTLYILKKPRKGEGQLLLIIAMCGISTAFWGLMFGSWFGEELVPAVLFVPMEQPLLMLGLALALGLLQICFGMGMKAVADFRAKRPLDAIFGQFSWWVLFIGIGLLAGSIFGVSSLKLPGIILMAIGAAMILVGGAMGKKGIFGKILGGFANVYNITSFLSDILSYARLFGLGLATGVVGMVVNKIALVLADLIPFGIGWVFAIPVLIIGHVFNIGINTLGAYVHDCRLQYIEYFSRFYTGAGHQFVPFGSDTKYTYLLNGTNSTAEQRGAKQ